MTQLDPLGPGNHPDMHKTVDAQAAASALGDIFKLIATPGTVDPTAATSSSSDLFKAVPGDQTQQPAQPTGAPTGAASGDHAAPVPAGTPINQGYGGQGGHPGIDFGVPLNTQLLAAASGTVTAAGNTDPGGYGNEVEIQTPDGFTIRYGHLHQINLKIGDQVHAGQIIGTSGGEAGGAGSGNSTGAHLHFEVRTQGHSIDPTPFLAGGYQIIGGQSTTDTNIPSTADPQALASVALKNVIAGLTGQPLQDDPSQQQQPGQQQQSTGGTGDTDPGAVDSFLNAIKTHESGGNYQIYNQSGLSNASGAYQFLGSTWRGLGGSTAAAAQASPAEQDRIARSYAMNLFNQFHSWKLAAIAWYGGPGIAQQVASGKNVGSPSGQGSYTAYGDTIASMMQSGVRK